MHFLGKYGIFFWISLGHLEKIFPQHKKNSKEFSMQDFLCRVCGGDKYGKHLHVGSLYNAAFILPVLSTGLAIRVVISSHYITRMAFLTKHEHSVAKYTDGKKQLFLYARRIFCISFKRLRFQRPPSHQLDRYVLSIL